MRELQQDRDQYTEYEIVRQLSGPAEHCHILAYHHLPSTNTCAKEWARDLQDATLIVAGTQSAGRGRMQRVFYSPGNTGLYMSLLIKRPLSAAMATRLTTMAAVATAQAIEDEIGRHIGIKWVNDLYLDGRKVCGILTEGSIAPGTAALDFAVIGIGVNLTPPSDGFPQEIETIAGAILPHGKDVAQLRCRLSARILNRLLPLLEQALPGGVMEETVWKDYRERLLLLGRAVVVHRGDGSATAAYALDIDRDYRLLVRYENGATEALESGEVSIRL